MNVPDDASWETLNESNNPLEQWTYLNKTIQDKFVGKNYAQLPREVEIAISCDILEKERAIVGSANFGHAPHTDDYVKDVYVPSDKNTPFLTDPTEFHKNMVEYNGDSTPTLDTAKRIDASQQTQITNAQINNFPNANPASPPVQSSIDPTKLPTTSGINAGKSVI